MYTIVHRKLNSGAQCAPAWICSDNGAQRRQTQIYECFGQHTWGEKAECVAWAKVFYRPLRGQSRPSFQAAETICIPQLTCMYNKIWNKSSPQARSNGQWQMWSCLDSGLQSYIYLALTFEVHTYCPSKFECLKNAKRIYRLQLLRRNNAESRNQLRRQDENLQFLIKTRLHGQNTLSQYVTLPLLLSFEGTMNILVVQLFKVNTRFLCVQYC